MATPARATERTVLTLADARGLVEMAFDADGLRDEVEQEALLLFDIATAWAETADLGRRRRQHMEDTAEDSDWLIWLERQHRRGTEDRLKAA